MTTWRIIPVSKRSTTMASQSLSRWFPLCKWPLFMAYKSGWLTTYKAWGWSSKYLIEAHESPPFFQPPTTTPQPKVVHRFRSSSSLRLLQPWPCQPGWIKLQAFFVEHFHLPSITSWWFFTHPFEKYAQVKLDHLCRDPGEKSELFETTTYLAILLVTFLGWLSDPLNGCWWPPNRGSFVGSRRFHHLIMLWIHFLGSRWVSSLSVHLSWRSSIHQSFHMDVSKNSGTPQIIHFNRVFHYKSSILEYPYFWKHPYGTCPQNYTLLVLPVGWKKLPKHTDFFHQKEALNGRMLLGILVGKVSGREINKGSGKEHTDGIHLLKMRISI